MGRHGNNKRHAKNGSKDEKTTIKIKTETAREKTSQEKSSTRAEI